MRILIISTFFPPLNSIASLRPYYWAKYWSAAGHEVTVLTQPSDFDHTSALAYPCSDFTVLYAQAFRPKALKRAFQESQKISLPQSKAFFWSRWKKRFFEGVERLRSRTGIFKACRMPDFSDLWILPALKSISQASPHRNSWDVVVSTSGPYAVHCIAYKLKQRGLAKQWVADFRDLWSDSFLFPGLFPFNRLEKLLEKRLMRHADKITTVSAPLGMILEKKHGAKVHVIENGVDFEDCEKLDKALIFPRDGKFRLVYTGVVYDGIYHPKPLLQAIQELSADPYSLPLIENLEVLFVGHPGNLLPRWVEEMQLAAWVKILAPVKREDALRMQRDASALLFLLCGDLQKDGIFSGKIFEYLYSSTPIIVINGVSDTSTVYLSPDIEVGAFLGCDVSKIKAYLMQSLQNCQAGTPKPNAERDKLKMMRYSRQHLSLKLLDLVKQK